MRRKANTEFEKYFLKIKTKNDLSWGMALVFSDLNSVISTPTTSSNKFKRNKRRHSGKKNLSTPMPTTSSNKCKALSNLDGDWISSDEEAQEVEAFIQQAIQGRGQTRNIKSHTSTSGGMQSNCIILSKGACPRQAIHRTKPLIATCKCWGSLLKIMISMSIPILRSLLVTIRIPPWEGLPRTSKLLNEGSFLEY